MSFLKAYLEGFGNMVKAASDLDRLHYMPQRVEDGVMFNFKGKDMFKGIIPELEGVDFELLPAERVTETSRYTEALKRDYFKNFSKLMDMVAGDVDQVVEDKVAIKVNPLYEKLYKIVEAGDKKEFRTLRKELKDQWFALDPEEVEDAIMDLADAVADKDLDFAKEIIDGLGQDLESHAEDDAPIKEVTEEVDNAIKEEEVETSDEVAEIIEDIKSAIDDGDEDDFKELLAELKSLDKNAYKEWKDAFVSQPESKDEDNEVLNEILEDLSVAITDNDEAEIKELLEELKEEVGEDSEIYTEWFEKCSPKKETRRSRRGK